MNISRKSKLLAGAVLSTALLVGCGGTSNEPATGGQQGTTGGGGTTTTGIGTQQHVFSPDNPVTISMLITSNEMAPAPGNRITELIRERLGVTLTWEVVAEDMQSQRLGVLLAAGAELPDLIGVTDTEASLVQGGALLRLDPFLDSGNFPRLAEFVAPYRGHVSWSGGGVEHGLYQFPNYSRFFGDPPILPPTHFGTGFWLQKSVLEWHGFPDLSNMTLDRYFDMIEAYMQAHPTINGLPTIGFTFPVQGRTWGMTNPPMFLAGSPNNGAVLVRHDGQGGVYAELYATSIYAEEYFRFLNAAFNRGLVDPETFSRTVDDYVAALATGRVLGMHDQRWAFGAGYDALVNAGMDERTWIATMPTLFGREPRYQNRPVISVNQGFGVSVSNPNPELALGFLEQLMSPEWQTIISWGEEGIDYHVGADGLFYMTPEQRANRVDPVWVQHNRVPALLTIMPKMQGTLPDGNAFDPNSQPAEFLQGLSDFNRNFLENYGKQTWTDFLNAPPPNAVYEPAWQISMPAGSVAQMANAQMEEAALMFLPRAIMAPVAEFDSIWQEYVNHIALIDTDAIEAVFTAGLMARVEAAGGLN